MSFEHPKMANCKVRVFILSSIHCISIVSPLYPYPVLLIRVLFGIGIGTKDRPSIP